MGLEMSDVPMFQYEWFRRRDTHFLRADRQEEDQVDRFRHHLDIVANQIAGSSRCEKVQRLRSARSATVCTHADPEFKH